VNWNGLTRKRSSPNSRYHPGHLRGWTEETGRISDSVPGLRVAILTRTFLNTKRECYFCRESRLLTWHILFDTSNCSDTGCVSCFIIRKLQISPAYYVRIKVTCLIWTFISFWTLSLRILFERRRSLSAVHGSYDKEQSALQEHSWEQVNTATLVLISGYVRTHCEFITK
jgi:hypothetical protein